MIELVATPGGEPSLRVDRRYVHSRRDPRTEARRFLDSRKKSEFHPTVLVVGAGLGYLIEEAHRAFPGCRVIALYLSAACRAHSIARAAEAWDPSDPTDAGAFLLNVLEEDALPGLLALFWRPALAAFPDTAHDVEKRVRQGLNRLNAALATAGYFGPRWFRNALANYLNTDAWCRLNRTDLPVVVAAPGPTLSLVIPALRDARSRFVLVAAASALLPLERADVTPDLVVHQDAGFYSGEHLRHRAAAPHGESASGRSAGDGGAVDRAAAGRDSVGSGIVMVQPLSARPVPEVAASVAWISYDHPADALLRDHDDAPYLALGQLGTVTATATRLALNLTTGAVYLAGVDMAAKDLQSHVRGHSFEEYHLGQTDRLHPALTTHLGRSITRENGSDTGADGWRVSADLEIYADWFTRLAEESRGPDQGATAGADAGDRPEATPHESGRLRRLAPSPVDLGIPIATLSELTALPLPDDSDHAHSVPPGLVRQVTPPPERERARRIAAALEAWRRAIEQSMSTMAATPATPGRAMRLPTHVRNLAWHLALPELLRVDRLERGASREDSSHASASGPTESGEIADAIYALRKRLLSTIDRMEARLSAQAHIRTEAEPRTETHLRNQSYLQDSGSDPE